MKIFVQIASYRDSQLPLTLRDCLANARHPDQLHFCVAHQHDDDAVFFGVNCKS
jgi:Glycosyltransferase (GlcNAc)